MGLMNLLLALIVAILLFGREAVMGGLFGGAVLLAVVVFLYALLSILGWMIRGVVNAISDARKEG